MVRSSICSSICSLVRVCIFSGFVRSFDALIEELVPATFNVHFPHLVGDSRRLAKVVIVCNFEGSNLIHPEQAATLFHEFGHAFATLLSKTRFQHTSGTRCALDFVETPSTLMEHFFSDYRVLKQFAIHHKTKEVLPEKQWNDYLLNKNRFFGLDTQQQLLFSIIDMKLHGEKDSSNAEREREIDRKSLEAVIDSVQKGFAGVPPVPGTAIQASKFSLFFLRPCARVC
jgi:Zn-dependent oligopeptidase